MHDTGDVQLAVALVSEERVGARALQLLAERGHRVVGVFTSEAGMGAVRARGQSLGATIREGREVRDPGTGAWLRERGASLLLNVHSLHVVHPDVLAAPRLGAYNLHPGPLPERAARQLPPASTAGVMRCRVTPYQSAPS